MANKYVCPKCEHYFRINAKQRIEMVLDRGSFVEWDKEIVTDNPLQFPNYIEKIEKAQKLTGLDEAVITGKGTIKGKEVAIVCGFHNGKYGKRSRRKNYKII